MQKIMFTELEELRVPENQGLQLILSQAEIMIISQMFKNTILN